MPAAHPRVPRARLEDVARAAGVSKSTVSRVLSGDATLSVRDETRERVRGSAPELVERRRPLLRPRNDSQTGKEDAAALQPSHLSEENRPR